MPCWSARGWTPPATPARRSRTWSRPGRTRRPRAPRAEAPHRPQAHREPAGRGARGGPYAGGVTLFAHPPAPDVGSGHLDATARPEWPDATGHFGVYGGRFVPEALVAALDELTAAYEAMRVDPVFLAEFAALQRDYTGRPSPVTEVARFAEHAGGARVLLKREDLNHTGSHKINNVLGQALLTRRMGKQRVIAE